MMASQTAPANDALVGNNPHPQQAPALPAPHEARLNAVLSQWRHWIATPALQEQPKATTYLPAGSGHYVVLVSAGAADDAQSPSAPSKQQFIVRLAQHTIQRPGYLLTTEARWMLLAHRQRLAPTLVFVDILNQALVMDYIATEVTSKVTAKATSKVTSKVISAATFEAEHISPGDIGTLLNAIHQLPAEGPALDLKAIYNHYLETAEQARPIYPPTGDQPLAGCDSTLCQQVAAGYPLLPADNKDFNRCLALLSRGPQCLCHNDLTRGNILRSSSGPVAIDWEYAGIGSPWFDIAAALADLSAAPSHPHQPTTSRNDFGSCQTPATLKTDDASTLTGRPLVQHQHQARQQLLSSACPDGIDAPLLAVAEAVYETIATAWQATQVDPAHGADYRQQVTQADALAQRLRRAADAAETAETTSAAGYSKL